MKCCIAFFLLLLTIIEVSSECKTEYLQESQHNIQHQSPYIQDSDYSDEVDSNYYTANTDCNFKMIYNPKNYQININFDRHVRTKHFKSLTFVDSFIPTFSHNTIQYDPFAAGSLEKLVIRSSKVNFIEEQAFLYFYHLEEINFENNNISQLKMDVFYSLLLLETIKLANNNISIQDSGVFSDLPALKMVDLSKNYITSIDNIFFNVPSLNHLNMSYNSITIITKSSFNSTPKLLTLDLKFNSIKDIPVATFGRLNDLKVLNLSHNLIEQLNKGSFVGLSSLSELDLGHNNIAYIPDLTFHNTPKLIQLQIQNNSLKDLQVESLQLTTLHYINIDLNKFSCKILSKLLHKFKTIGVEVQLGQETENLSIQGIACYDGEDFEANVKSNEINHKFLILNNFSIEGMTDQFLNKFLKNSSTSLEKYVVDTLSFHKSFNELQNGTTKDFEANVKSNEINPKFLMLNNFSIVGTTDEFLKKFLKNLSTPLEKYLDDALSFHKSFSEFQNATLKKDDVKAFYKIFNEFENGTKFFIQEALMNFSRIITQQTRSELAVEKYFDEFQNGTKLFIQEALMNFSKIITQQNAQQTRSELAAEKYLNEFGNGTKFFIQEALMNFSRIITQENAQQTRSELAVEKYFDDDFKRSSFYQFFKSFHATAADNNEKIIKEMLIDSDLIKGKNFDGNNLGETIILLCSFMCVLLLLIFSFLIFKYVYYKKLTHRMKNLSTECKCSNELEAII